MSKVEFELDYDGVGALLKSEMIGSYIRSIANTKVNGVKGNYNVNLKSGQSRKYVVVSPADKETYFRNLNTNEMLKVVGV